MNPVLLLLCGQSNMTGGAIADPLPAELFSRLEGSHIWTPDAGGFRPMNTRPDYQRRGFGPEIGFALECAEAGLRDLYLVKVARGGASIFDLLDYRAPGAAWNRLLVFARQAKGLLGAAPEALIWMQGENEARSAVQAGRYGAQFSAALADLRAQLDGPDLQVICGEVSGKAEHYPHNDQINAAFHSAGAQVFPSKDLSRLDRVHYDARSMLVAGRRAARAWLATRPAAPLGVPQGALAGAPG